MTCHHTPPVERCLRGLCVVGSGMSICPYYCNGRDPLNPEIIARLWRDARCVLGLVAGPPAHLWAPFHRARSPWRSPVQCDGRYLSSFDAYLRAGSCHAP